MQQIMTGKTWPDGLWMAFWGPAFWQYLQTLHTCLSISVKKKISVQSPHEFNGIYHTLNTLVRHLVSSPPPTYLRGLVDGQLAAGEGGLPPHGGALVVHERRDGVPDELPQAVVVEARPSQHPECEQRLPGGRATEVWTECRRRTFHLGREFPNSFRILYEFLYCC